jgi:hypothetical protein
MPDEPAVSPELDWVLARFPEDAPLVRRLFLTEPIFRCACEGYRLAREGLSTFEKLAMRGPRAELGEYRNLVRELEAELLAMFSAADGVARPYDGGQPEARSG